MTSPWITPTQHARQRARFPLPWPDCDVHRVIAIHRALTTRRIVDLTRLPTSLVHRVCTRLERYGLLTSQPHHLEHGEMSRRSGFGRQIVWRVA